METPKTTETTPTIILKTETTANQQVTNPWREKGGLPTLNKICMVISVILVFGIDVLILISNTDLAGFWYLMLAVFAAFVVFFLLENFVYPKHFATTTTNLDIVIGLLNSARNITFILNFIPFIQLIGLFIVVAAGIPFVILYIILISIRFKIAHTPAA